LVYRPRYRKIDEDGSAACRALPRFAAAMITTTPSGISQIPPGSGTWVGPDEVWFTGVTGMFPAGGALPENEASTSGGAPHTALMTPTFFTHSGIVLGAARAAWIGA
jgi:hypothetical protein